MSVRRVIFAIIASVLLLSWSAWADERDAVDRSAVECSAIERGLDEGIAIEHGSDEGIAIERGLNEGSADGRVVTRTIEVSYPAIDPLAFDVDPGTVASIEAAVAEQVAALLAELLPWGNVSGSYEVHVDRAGVLSLSFLYSGYAFPAAHPAHVMGSLTADWETGSVYALADLFVDDRYLDVIAGVIRERVAAEKEYFFDEAVHVAADQGFYLTEEALVIYYQLYEIAPYAYGFPRFEIPLASLRELVAPGSPIDRLLSIDH